MIKNSKQASATRKELDKLEKAKQEHENDKNSIAPLKYEIGIKAFNGLIDDLKNRLDYYERLKNGQIICLKEKNIEDFPEILIAARISKGMTHKELAALLDMPEQQIQRYEITNYEGVRWETLSEISLALEIKLNFKNIQIKSERSVFEFVNVAQEEMTNKASNKLLENKSFF